MPQPRLPWIMKYRPRRIDDVVNQDQAKKKLVPWILEWLESGPPAVRAALLYGPAGVGKTSLVESIAREYNLELVEMNASDFRRRSDIESRLAPLIRRRPLFKRGILILLDEVDGMAGKEDWGGVEAILELIPKTRNPIVMTANDPWKDRLRPLRNAVMMVEFRPLTPRNIIIVLKKICAAERLHCEDDALKFIAERADGDLRAAINDLESIGTVYGRVTYDLVRELLAMRAKTIDLFKTLNRIFYAKYAWAARNAVTSSEEDYERLMAWLNDNVPRKYDNIEDIYRAFEALSRADIMLSRAKFRGHWTLLSYVFDYLGAGIAFARRHQHARARYQYPEKIKLMGASKARRERRDNLARHIAKVTHSSRRMVLQDDLPFLSVIFRYAEDPRIPARLALGMELNREMVDYLAGSKAKKIIAVMEELEKEAMEELHRKKEAPGKGEEGTGGEVRRPSVDWGPLMPAGPSTDKTSSKTRSSRSKRRRRR